MMVEHSVWDPDTDYVRETDEVSTFKSSADQ